MLPNVNLVWSIPAKLQLTLRLQVSEYFVPSSVFPCFRGNSLKLSVTFQIKMF